MARRPKDLPDFLNPPVVEVVLGVQFEQLASFRAVHAGLLWNAFRNDFPNVIEQPLLDPTFETFGTKDGKQVSRIQLQLGVAPQIPRLWLVNADDTELIQFQPDRLIHNWRKTGDNEAYPRYETIRERFLQEFQRVEDFLKNEKIGEININQCEISYVNHITVEENSTLKIMAGHVFQHWNDVQDSSIGETEDVGFLVRYILRSKDGTPIGRLAVTAEPRQTREGKPTIQLSLTVRGRPAESTINSAIGFLDFGREKIVRAFAELTTAEMHEYWRRK